jgi:hypothetical protein
LGAAIKNDRAAARRLFDRYGVRAEWARLKGAPEQPPIERGRWYRIVDYTGDDLVTLEVGGSEVEAACSLLNLLRDLPEKGTVYHDSRWEEHGSQMTYVFVCPKGHAQPHVDLRSHQIRCNECQRDYQWEREKPE